MMEDYLFIIIAMLGAFIIGYAMAATRKKKQEHTLLYAHDPNPMDSLKVQTAKTSKASSAPGVAAPITSKEEVSGTVDTIEVEAGISETSASLTRRKPKQVTKSRQSAAKRKIETKKTPSADAANKITDSVDADITQIDPIVKQQELASTQPQPAAPIEPVQPVSEIPVDQIAAAPLSVQSSISESIIPGEIRASKKYDRGGIPLPEPESVPSIRFTHIGVGNPKSEDDLTKIRGIGEVIAEQLKEAGINTFRQISRMEKQDIDAVTTLIEFFPGRIEQDDWVGQAKALLKQS